MSLKKPLKILGGTALVLVLAAGAGYTALRKQSPREKLSAEKGGQAIVAEEVSWYKGRQKIYGRLYRPQNTPNNCPLMVFCHGFGSNLSAGEDWCRAAASAGYVAYSFDFRGGGRDSQSDGRTLDMSVLTEKDDLELVIRKLKGDSRISADNIFILGESQGGQVASLYAAEHPGDIKGLALLYPAFCIQDDALRKYPKTRDIPDSTDWGFITVGKAYYKDIRGLDPYKKIGRYPGDVLIMHGTADSMVPYEYSSRAARTFPSARLESFTGAGHGFQGADKTRAIKMVIDFMDGLCKKNVSDSE